jgi:hypothetical protein
MKIEFAPPGTDPTRIPSSPASRTDIMETIKDNWLLVGGIVAFLIATVFRFNLIPGKQEELATPEPEVVAAATTEPWCIYLDSILIPEGDTVQVGEFWVQCWNAEIKVGPKVSMSAP